MANSLSKNSQLAASVFAAVAMSLGNLRADEPAREKYTEHTSFALQDYQHLILSVTQTQRDAGKPVYYVIYSYNHHDLDYEEAIYFLKVDEIGLCHFCDIPEDMKLGVMGVMERERWRIDFGASGSCSRASALYGDGI
jgi:hypothetical protein